MPEQKQEPKYSESVIIHQDGRIEQQVFKDDKFLKSTTHQYMPNGAYVITTMCIGNITQNACF